MTKKLLHSLRTKTTLPKCIIVALILNSGRVAAFSSPVFTPQKSIVVPTKTSGVDIELPNFEELFERIGKASPLAELALKGRDGGFFVMDDTAYSNTPNLRSLKDSPDMKWKTVESNDRKVVHQIQKIDNFQKRGPPLLRFRSSLKGPCVGNRFAHFIMDLPARKKWDPQIDNVYEIYPVQDLKSVTDIQEGKYGDCTLCGVGYTLTKPNLIVDAREQLTLCGIQEFPDTGATLIWGVELEDKYDYLFPEGKRHTRARSHLFSTAIVPTGENEFDVEYLLQLDIGGMVPTFLTTPVVVNNVKAMFDYAKEYYGAGEGGELDQYLKAKMAVNGAQQ